MKCKTLLTRSRRRQSDYHVIGFAKRRYNRLGKIEGQLILVIRTVPPFTKLIETSGDVLAFLGPQVIAQIPVIFVSAIRSKFQPSLGIVSGVTECAVIRSTQGSPKQAFRVWVSLGLFMKATRQLYKPLPVKRNY